MSICQPLPLFIHELEACWPFATRLNGCKLVSARFDPDEIGDQDMLKYGLQLSGRSRKRHSEYLAGRLCAAAALETNQLPARDADSGRPLWPNGWCGSITHSHGQAAAVVAATADWEGLGLDMERLLETGRALRLRNAILTEDEQSWLSNERDDSAARLLTLFFSAKESLYKAINPLAGVYFGFQDARINEYDAEGGTLSLELLRDLSEEYRSGMEFPCLWTSFGHGMLTLVYLAA